MDVEIQLLEGHVIPRSILVTKLQDTVYVMAGLGDGTLYTFALDVSTGKLSERKRFTLGSQQIKLSQFELDNKAYVFACADYPRIIHS